MNAHRTRRRDRPGDGLLVVAAVAPLAAVLLAGCGSSLSPAETAEQCAGLAADTARAGLAATPTREQATDAADRLDGRLTQLRDPRVHDAAVALHSHLHGVDAALAKGDVEKAAKLAAEARADAVQVARACGLPEKQFLGD